MPTIEIARPRGTISNKEFDETAAWFTKSYRGPGNGAPPIDMGDDGNGGGGEGDGSDGDGNNESKTYMDIADFACAVWQFGFYINSRKCLNPEAAYILRDRSHKALKHFLGANLYAPPKELLKSKRYIKRSDLGNKNDTCIFVDIQLAAPLIVFFLKSEMPPNLIDEMVSHFEKMICGSELVNSQGLKSKEELCGLGFDYLDNLTRAPCVWLDKIFKDKVASRLPELALPYRPIRLPPRPWFQPP